MKDRDTIISETIEELSKLMKDDFHGFRSEIWNTISFALDEQDKKIETLKKIIKELYNTLQPFYSKSLEGKDYLDKMKKAVEGENK